MTISSRTFRYDDCGTRLTGLLYTPGEASGRVPGILLLHGGAGLDEHAREQAQQYAGLGYAVFACDMLGEGIAGDRQRVVECLTMLRDKPDHLVRRALAGLDVLAGCPQTDGRIAAIGFCFGGMAALALARTGTALAAAVSIHGSLATSRPAEPGQVAAKILVCHGASDPHVPPGQVTAFAAEMTRAEADWQLIMYGGAMHGFTHRHAAPGTAPGVAYHQASDERSFGAVASFLAEAFRRDADPHG
jgi:dienelactone hydrolase